MFDGYVLDAHALIWHLEGNPKLGSRAHQAFSDHSVQLFLPAIALAEACYVIAHGRVDIKDLVGFLAAIDADPRMQIVPLDRKVIERSISIPSVTEMHDSQIVATAVELRESGANIAIVTNDANITASGIVPVVW